MSCSSKNSSLTEKPMYKDSSPSDKEVQRLVDRDAASLVFWLAQTNFFSELTCEEDDEEDKKYYYEDTDEEVQVKDYSVSQH